MADGDVPLVTSFGGSEIEFNANGSKVTRAPNSRLVDSTFAFKFDVFSLQSVIIKPLVEP